MKRHEAGCAAPPSHRETGITGQNYEKMLVVVGGSH